MQYMEIGKIVNTHGVRGDVKIDPWCDGFDVFSALDALYIRRGTEYVAYTPVKIEPYKQHALVHFDGVEDKNAADALKGFIVYADKERLPLPDDRVFIADLIDLPVIDAASGVVYGRLSDVLDGAAQQLYVVTRPNGAVSYMPAIREFIDRIELDQGIYVTPPEGLFDEI